ncbi:YCF48-related protein [Sphingobacterium suaedae]|uniref:YCF48-related protein n=1 Tax=Sphingobacterium suaedae TaxID=1686402 RepID=A0ABW5KDN0_9SPHI
MTVFSDYLKTITSILLCAVSSLSFAQHFLPIARKDAVSFRGVETYKTSCVWVSGSKGTVGKSVDGGKSWLWVNPNGYQNYDFRDIEVFSEKEAIIVSAGSPAVILRTSDGGISWTEVYRDDRPAAFLDGIDFNGAEGFVIGDPFDGRFQLLHSKDRGKTWNDVSDFILLLAEEGEAAFAASGTSLCYFRNDLWVGTGGVSAHLFRRNEKKLKMEKLPCPIIQGSASQGIFSVDFRTDKIGIVVGGDYKRDSISEQAILLTQDGGFTWVKPNNSGSGFKSCVKYLDKHVILTTGTSGTDISYDGGYTWKNLSAESFNSFAVGKRKKEIYLVGSQGNISKLIL